jgi:hypothetical protein
LKSEKERKLEESIIHRRCTNLDVRDKDAMVVVVYVMCIHGLENRIFIRLVQSAISSACIMRASLRLFISPAMAIALTVSSLPLCYKMLRYHENVVKTTSLSNSNITVARLFCHS